MAITQPTTGTLAVTTTANGGLSIPIPTVQVGDLLVMVVYCRNTCTFGSSGAITNWYQYVTPTSNATYGSLGVYTRRVANTNEGGTNVSVATTNGTSETTMGQIAAFRGVYGSTSSDCFDNTLTTITQVAAPSSPYTYSHAAITTNNALSMLVFILGELDGPNGSEAWSSITSNVSNAAFNIGNTGGNDASIGLFYGVNAAAGTSGTMSANGNTNARAAGSSFALSLRKAFETVSAPVHAEGITASDQRPDSARTSPGLNQEGTTASDEWPIYDYQAAPVAWTGNWVWEEGVTATDEPSGLLATQMTPTVDAIAATVTAGSALTVSGITHYVLRVGESATPSDELPIYEYTQAGGAWTGNWVWEEGATATDSVPTVQVTVDSVTQESDTASDSVPTAASVRPGLVQEGITASDQRPAAGSVRPGLVQESLTLLDDYRLRSAAEYERGHGAASPGDEFVPRLSLPVVVQEGAAAGDGQDFEVVGGAWTGNWTWEEGSAAGDTVTPRTVAAILTQDGTTAADGAGASLAFPRVSEEGNAAGDLHGAAALATGVSQEGSAADEGRPAALSLLSVTEEGAAAGDTVTGERPGRTFAHTIEEGARAGDTPTSAPVFAGLITQEGGAAGDSLVPGRVSPLVEQEGAAAGDDSVVALPARTIEWTLGEGARATDTLIRTISTATYNEYADATGDAASPGDALACVVTLRAAIGEGATATHGRLGAAALPGLSAEGVTATDGVRGRLLFGAVLRESVVSGDARESAQNQLLVTETPMVNAIAAAVTVPNVLVVTGGVPQPGIGEGTAAGLTLTSLLTMGLSSPEGAAAGDGLALNVIASHGLISDFLGEGVAAGDAVEGVAVTVAPSVDAIVATVGVGDVLVVTGRTQAGGSAGAGVVSEGSAAGDGHAARVIAGASCGEGAAAGDGLAQQVPEQTATPVVNEIVSSLARGTILVVSGGTTQPLEINNEGAAAGDGVSCAVTVAVRVAEGAAAGDARASTSTAAIMLPGTLYGADASVITATLAGQEMVFAGGQYAEFIVNAVDGGTYTVTISYNAPFGGVLTLKDGVTEIARWTVVPDPLFSEEEEGS